MSVIDAIQHTNDHDLFAEQMFHELSVFNGDFDPILNFGWNG
jgi:hypothetical protein